MTIYIIMLICALLFGILLCEKKVLPMGKEIYCICSALGFTFISATRFSTGYDYNMYASIYHNYLFADISDISYARIEKGISIPLYFLRQYTDTYIPMFIVTSIIICIGVFLLIYKFSEKPWISVTAFLTFGIFFNSLNFLRQFIAALFVALAVIKYIKEKNLFKYVLCIITAAVFHWSALIMLPFYFILSIKPNKWVLSVYSLGLIAVYMFSIPVMNFLTQTFYVYRGYNPLTNAEMSNGLPWKYTVMFAVPLILSLIFKKKLIEKDSANTVYINSLLFAVVFEFIGTKHAIISRFSLLFFLPFIVMLMPALYEIIKEYLISKFSKNQKFACSVGACAGLIFSVIFYIIMLHGNYNGVVPYKSILTIEQDEMYRKSDDTTVTQTEITTETSIDIIEPDDNDEDINIEDYYVDWDNFDWNEDNWDD